MSNCGVITVTESEPDFDPTDTNVGCALPTGEAEVGETITMTVSGDNGNEQAIEMTWSLLFDGEVQDTYTNTFDEEFSDELEITFNQTGEIEVGTQIEDVQEAP